jgi:hypothetical protein
MDDSELLQISRREHALYRELAAAYHAMASVLTDERAPVDPAWIVSAEAGTEATVAALRNTSAALAPHRLTGVPVPAEVADAWRASARLAGETAELGNTVMQLARARQAALAARLAALAGGRRGLADYRAAANTSLARSA